MGPATKKEQFQKIVDERIRKLEFGRFRIKRKLNKIKEDELRLWQKISKEIQGYNERDPVALEDVLGLLTIDEMKGLQKSLDAKSEGKFINTLNKTNEVTKTFEALVRIHSVSETDFKNLKNTTLTRLKETIAFSEQHKNDELSLLQANFNLLRCDNKQFKRFEQLENKEVLQSNIIEFKRLMDTIGAKGPFRFDYISKLADPKKMQSIGEIFKAYNNLKSTSNTDDKKNKIEALAELIDQDTSLLAPRELSTLIEGIYEHVKSDLINKDFTKALYESEAKLQQPFRNTTLYKGLISKMIDDSLNGPNKEDMLENCSQWTDELSFAVQRGIEVMFHVDKNWDTSFDNALYSDRLAGSVTSMLFSKHVEFKSAQQTGQLGRVKIQLPAVTEAVQNFLSTNPLYKDFLHAKELAEAFEKNPTQESFDTLAELLNQHQDNPQFKIYIEKKIPANEDTKFKQALVGINLHKIEDQSLKRALEDVRPISLQQNN